jgi:DNA-binding XRE family transcriptional regulator
MRRFGALATLFASGGEGDEPEHTISGGNGNALGAVGRSGSIPRRTLPCSESDFLARLGERLRTMRLMRDMSRRELARRSGISERYIAQIEAGKGNVSIVLLLRIAHAVRVD